MPVFGFLVRVFCYTLLAAWVGGFSVYGGVVIPILHDAIGVPETAAITRRVTNWLNGIGVASMIAWVGVHFLDRRLRIETNPNKSRSGLLFASCTLLAALFFLHARMDSLLDSGSLGPFYRFHRYYLVASTLQWLANLALLGIGPGFAARQDRSKPIEA